MTEIRHCPQCGAELPPDAPEGVCPKCVLGLGFASSQDSSSGADPQGSAAKSEPIHESETVAPTSEQGGEGGGSGVAPDAGPAGTGAYRGPFTAPTPEELAKHFPHLEIIELLGQGGMGAVYKAREPDLDRLVAVKILPPEAARDPAFAERFHREARALAKLNHPNIVAVYGIGQAEGLYYFIMEFVDGVNLRQLIRSGECQPEEALRIVPQICEALQFAHDEGIVHRDIKPENILLDKRGRLKIADFGLARLFGPPRTDYTLTGPQQVMGTPNYMAPEQMDDPLKVDHRADIYSLGVVFYEMLTGELPRGRFAPPSKKVQVDVRLDEVVLRALEQQPERRYQQASEVKTDVEIISRSRQAGRVGQVSAAHQDLTQVSAQGKMVGREDLAHPTAATATEAGKLKLQGPADALILAGGAALLTALGVGLWLWLKWDEAGLSESDKGNLVGMSVGDAVYALVIIVAGVLMRRLSARLFTLVCVVIGGLFYPAVVALNVVMEMKSIPQWPVVIPLWLGVPVAIWATVVLFRHDVRAAFQDQTRSRSAARKSREAPPPPSAWGRLDWRKRMLFVGGIIAAGVFAKKLLHPDISEPMVIVLMLLSLAAILADVLLYRRQRQGLQALFALLGGLVGLLTYLLVAPMTLLKWLYDFTESPQGRDDVAAARVVILLIAAWLVYLMVLVRRKMRRNSGSGAAKVSS